MTTTKTDSIRDFFVKKVPKEWLTGDLEVSSDGEEILVVIPIKDDAGGFRERTREERMTIGRRRAARSSTARCRGACKWAISASSSPPSPCP